MERPPYRVEESMTDRVETIRNCWWRCTLRRVLALFLLALTAQAQAPLSNDDVIKLVQVGLSAGVIIEKIASSPASFDTSTDALVRLAGAKVPPDVIKAMVEKTGTAAAPPPAPPAAKVERVVLGPVLFDYDHREWEGTLVIDERGVTFCCSRNMDLARSNDFLSRLCYLSFNLPAASITKSYLLADDDHLPALFLVDSANQGYFFSAPAKLTLMGRVDANAAADARAQFVHAAAALKAVNTQVVQAPMAYADIKPLYKGITRVHLSQPARCDKDYTIVEMKR